MVNTGLRKRNKKIMYKIEPYVKDYDIYSDEELTQLIVGLEKKYKLEDQSGFYNSLVNFSKNKNIPYHGWFKYREGYASELVKNIIMQENLSEDEYIIDPFCGSGTTLVEAALKGYSGLGIDVNPMSALLTDTKLNQYSDDELNELKSHMLNIESLKDQPLQIHKPEYRWDYLKKYFSEKNLQDLKSVVLYTEQVKSEKIKQFLLVACLAVTEEISDRKRDGNGLKKAPSKVRNVFKQVKDQLEFMYSDITTSPIEKNITGVGISSTADKLKKHTVNFNNITGKIPGAIIFSPPYANSFDYFESYKMELHLGNFVKSRSDMKNLRDLAVHSFVKAKQPDYEVDWFIDSMALEIEKAIPEKEKRTGRKDTRTRKVPALIRGYFNDMSGVISTCAEVLPTGKRTFIVVDQSAYLGKIVPTDLFLAKIAEKYNFEVEKVIVCRRARTSSQQYKLYPYLENTLRESIVVLRKKNKKS